MEGDSSHIAAIPSSGINDLFLFFVFLVTSAATSVVAGFSSLSASMMSWKIHREKLVLSLFFFAD